jgi:hypothetical protein
MAWPLGGRMHWRPRRRSDLHTMWVFSVNVAVVCTFLPILLSLILKLLPQGRFLRWLYLKFFSVSAFLYRGLDFIPAQPYTCDMQWSALLFVIMLLFFMLVGLAASAIATEISPQRQYAISLLLFLAILIVLSATAPHWPCIAS